LKTLRLIAVILLASASAFAWPACSGTWVQVPTGTSSANGAIYVTGDITFQCQKPSTTTNPTSTIATSTSTSNSSSSATGGSSTSKSGVSNSGNSSNTNNNTAQGGAGGSASQTQSTTSNATGNGDNANNSVTNVKTAAESAITPVGFPTAPCLGTFGGAAQSIPGGISFGGSKVDRGCDARQTALQFAVTLGNRLAAAKILCSTKAAKQAKLTLEDCLAFAPVPVPVAAPPVPPAVQPAPVSVTVNAPPAQVTVLPVLHEELTVTATRAQVHAETAKKPAVKRTAKPCIIPDSLKQPMEK
jgi:hypothetical protein